MLEAAWGDAGHAGAVFERAMRAVPESHMLALLAADYYETAKDVRWGPAAAAAVAPAAAARERRGAGRLTRPRCCSCCTGKGGA